MRKCIYCGHVFRGALWRCPACAEILPAAADHLAGFSRIELALRLSGLGREAAALLEQETFAHLRQELSLASVAEAIEARHDGRYGRFCSILRNLAGERGR